MADIITTTIEHDIVNGSAAWQRVRSARGRVATQVDVVRIQASAREIADVVGAADRVGVAVVEAPRQPESRIARYYGLWGHSPLGRHPDAATTWELASSREGGIAWVRRPLLEAVIDYVANCRAAFVFLADTAEVDPVSPAVLDRAFDEPTEALDWGEILVDATASGWAAVRVLRDEFGLEAQVFGTPEQLTGRSLL